MFNHFIFSDLARQQEAEARKQQEEEDEILSSVASEAEHTEEASVGKQDIDDEYNDNDEDVVINHEAADAATDDAHSVASIEHEESSKYESEEETE